MSDRVIVQVPMSRELKTAAEAVSSDYGFSSLQETIRVILNKLSKKELTISIREKTEESIVLSSRARKRYEQITDDFAKGKNIDSAKNVDDLFKQLQS